MTDRQTDRWTDASGKTICLPTVAAGDINIPCLLVYTRISFNSLLREWTLTKTSRELIRFGDFDHNFRGHHHMKAVFYSV